MQKFLTIFKIPELRNKILFTLGLLMIYRLGFFITMPTVDQSAVARVAAQQNDQSKGMMNMLGMFSGANIGAATIFGLGIMPYISASIIFQLLSNGIPSLEKLQKEGEAGRRKINEYTRYATVAICVFQLILWTRYTMGLTVGSTDVSVVNPAFQNWYFALMMVIAGTAGTMFLMWLGEQIDEFGIGNGISLIIMAGIVGRLPAALSSLWDEFKKNKGEFINPANGIGIDRILFLLAMFCAVIWVVIMITQGQRRIITQSAKHQRGRMIVGGTKHQLPLRVNQAGVMPIIFASSLLVIPAYLFGFFANTFNSNFFQRIANSFSSQYGFLYVVAEIGLIYFFCYFWTAITFNPKEMSNFLKDNGSFVPGYRPGKRTADYLEKVMVRITYVGAAFLAVIAIIPTLLSYFLGVPYNVANFFGGTGLLILISVALDLVQKIDSHLIMRNYDSLLTASQGG